MPTKGGTAVKVKVRNVVKQTFGEPAANGRWWADSGLLALGQLVAKAAYIFGAICPEHGQG